jgi:hypothetical protein
LLERDLSSFFEYLNTNPMNKEGNIILTISKILSSCHLVLEQYQERILECNTIMPNGTRIDEELPGGPLTTTFEPSHNLENVNVVDDSIPSLENSQKLHHQSNDYIDDISRISPSIPNDCDYHFYNHNYDSGIGSSSGTSQDDGATQNAFQFSQSKDSPASHSSHPLQQQLSSSPGENTCDPRLLENHSPHRQNTPQYPRSFIFDEGSYTHSPNDKKYRGGFNHDYQY